MATCFGAVRPLGQLRVFNIIVCNVRKQQVCNRNYTKRARKKKRTIQEEGKLDIGGILSGSGASPGNKLVPGSDTTTNKSLQDTAAKGWQSSKERTSLLRKGEKRVAIVAVVTMLIGVVAIKSVVYFSEKWRTPGDAAVDQPA